MSKKNDHILTKITDNNHSKIDWNSYEAFTPNFIGRKVIDPIKIEDIVPFINWKIFFKLWKYDEKFATVKNISMCGHCKAQWFAAFNEEDRAKAMEASKLYDTAFALLQKIVEIEAEYIKAVFVIGEAYSNSDTLYLNNTPVYTLHEQEKNSDDEFHNLSNYIAPKSANKKDYLAAFAVTAGAGTDYLLNKYRNANDNHSVMVLESLFQVLAEGATEWLHMQVRKEYWGYATNEELTIPGMFAAKYNGFRAIVGSPLLPNEQMNIDLNNLLKLDEIYISVNKNGKMSPAASISGFFFAHP